VRPTSRGRFITLEGGEGVGKSTQIRLLAEALETAGINVIQTREPGGTPAAEEIRNLFLKGDPKKWDGISETLLMYAARRNHVLQKIYPALEEGTWVICDRFSDSTMAYQGYARKLGRDTIEAIDRIAMGSFGPDMTLIMDLPFEVALERITARRGESDRMEDMFARVHKVVRGAFLDIAGREPDRCHLIDASGTVADVHARVKFAISARLGVSLN